MQKYLAFLFLVLFLNGCATGNKYGQQTCKDIHPKFTKAIKCLELKFTSLYPKKNDEYKETYNLVLKAVADNVYENKIDNAQAWVIYDDVVLGFREAKKKQEYLITVLSKYN